MESLSKQQSREELLASAAAFQGRVRSLLQRHTDDSDVWKDSSAPQAPAITAGASLLHSDSHSSFVDVEGSVKITAQEAVRGWVLGMGILDAVVSCLVPLAGGDGGDGIMERLAGLAEAEMASVVDGMKEPLLKCLSEAVGRLRSAKAPASAPAEPDRGGGGGGRGASEEVEAWLEDNDKFSAETAAYGDTDDFFSGLDGRIGLPSKRTLDGMRDEHCHAADSHDVFVTSNYGGTRTWPAEEWEAVFAPVGGKAYPGVGRTEARRLQDFVDLHEAKQAGLTLFEVCALRLYTGPMYVKYNAVLRRGPAAAVDALKGNAYATTLHTIVSGVIKLSRAWSIPPSRKVYRGIAGLRLPPKFWVKDAHGCCGGVELGFMSTTTKREVATHYCKSKEGRHATLIEIEVGQIDRGASLMWLSQYPGEEEVLLPPLSNLEVVGRPRLDVSGDGTVVVLPCRINCNLKTLTMDELVGRRKREMISMQQLLMQETRRNIGGAVWGRGSELAVSVLGDFETLREETEGTGAEKFNDDSFYRDAVNRTLNLKVGTERKWALLHDKEVDGVEGLRRRVVGSHAERFADVGFIYELRSGTDQVAFSSIISGNLDMVPVPCLETSQALVVWECVQTHKSCRRVAVLDESGKLFADVDTEEILQGSTATVPASMMDARQIGTLSCCFRLNPNLTTVKLPSLYLRDAGATALASNLAHCTWLLALDIGENAIGAPGCKAVTDTLSTNCTQLTSLRLAWNVLEASGCEALSEIFRKCRELRNLDMFFTRPGEAGLRSIAEHLTTTSLTSLEIGFSFGGAGGTEALGRMIEKNTELARIDVYEAGSATVAGSASFLSALQKHTSLTSLVLFDGIMDSQGCAEMLSGVIRNIQGIKSIVLSQNTYAAASLGLEASCHQLQRFVGIGCWPTDPAALAPLCRVLCRPTLRYLSDMGVGGWGVVHEHQGEGLSPDTRHGILHLVEEAERAGLSVNPDLVSISILESRFDTEEKMRMLGGFLRLCTSLQTIAIRGSHISSQGSLHLADVLAANSSSLTVLDLGFNQMGDEWAEVVAPRLAACHNLREIDLSNNEMGPDGVTKILVGVGQLSCLRKLDLAFNVQEYPLGYHCSNPAFVGAMQQLRGMSFLEELNLAGGVWPNFGNARAARALAQLPVPENLAGRKHDYREGGGSRFTWSTMFKAAPTAP